MYTGRARPRGIAVGIIANPVSTRDISRVIANATALQITDRAGIVLRALFCLNACGVHQFYSTPENSSDGAIALDDERELSFPNDNVTIEVVPDAFKTVNICACMRYAAKHGLMRMKTHKSN